MRETQRSDTATPTGHDPRAGDSPRWLADEDVLRQECRHKHVRDVDERADLQVYGYATDGVALLPGEASLGEVLNHVEQRIARGQGGILRAVLAILRYRDAGSRVKPARGRELRRQIVVLAGEPQVPTALPCRLA